MSTRLLFSIPITNNDVIAYGYPASYVTYPLTIDRCHKRIYAPGGSPTPGHKGSRYPRLIAQCDCRYYCDRY